MAFFSIYLSFAFGFSLADISGVCLGRPCMYLCVVLCCFTGGNSYFALLGWKIWEMGWCWEYIFGVGWLAWMEAGVGHK